MTAGGTWADWLGHQRRAAQLMSDALHAVTDWTAPTACADWDARALACHVVEEQTWIPALLTGASVGEAESTVRADLDALAAATGPQLVERWDALLEPVSAAWATAVTAESVPGTVVQLSYGTAPVEHYLAQQVCDTAIHSWDLAGPSGAAVADWPGDLAGAVEAFVHADLGDDPATHLFAPPVDGAAHLDCRDRALARTGRDPRRAR